MKLSILVAVLLALVLGAGLRGDLYHSIGIGDAAAQIRAAHADAIFCDYPTMFAMEDGQGVVVVTTDGTWVLSVTRFSAGAGSCSAKGIDPLPTFDASGLIGKTTEEMVELLGPPHADLGSGVYLFAYVLTNGTVTYFSSTGETISAVGTMDLFTQK